MEICQEEEVKSSISKHSFPQLQPRNAKVTLFKMKLSSILFLFAACVAAQSISDEPTSSDCDG
jgi:hypothetical protein